MFCFSSLNKTQNYILLHIQNKETFLKNTMSSDNCEMQTANVSPLLFYF